MLLVVEDAAARRERVRELLLSAVRRTSRAASSGRPVFAEAGLISSSRGRAARAAGRHLGELALRVRDLLDDPGAPVELLDLGVAVVSVMSPELRPARDTGAAGARVARCAAEALRAHATVAAPPAGTPVPDVPASLLWLICDLSERLRATGREGRLGRRWDAAVEARDAADLLVTTYRRWRPRLRGAGADRVARLAVTAAHAAVFSGFAAIELDDDDGCGRAVSPAATPPSLSAAAEAVPPSPPPVTVHGDTVRARREAVEELTTR